MAILSDDDFLGAPAPPAAPPGGAAAALPPPVPPTSGRAAPPGAFTDAQFLGSPGSHDILESAAPWNVGDEFVRGSTLGLSEPAGALVNATGNWLGGKGFDYETELGRIKGGRALWEGAHPYLGLPISLGGAAATLPLLPEAAGIWLTGGGLGRGALIGAGSGAISGAAENATSPGAAAKGALIGGATGAVTGAGTSLLASLVNPPVSEAARTLIDAGVSPTPGQLARSYGGFLGPGFSRAEEGVQSVPLFGDVVKWGQTGAGKDFIRGAIDQFALDPIGEKLEATPGTREAMKEMQDKVGDYWDNVTNGLGFQAGSPAAQQFSSDMGTLHAMAPAMGPGRGDQFNGILDQYLYSRMSPGGGMTGEAFKDAKSDIGKLANTYRNSPFGDEQQLGDALLETQMALRRALRTDNPDMADALDNADKAYGGMLRINQAAKYQSPEGGFFTPVQLDRAVYSLDPSYRKRAFAAGEAPMQAYAEAGKSVLGNRVPDSGTVTRGIVGGGLLAGLLGGGGEAVARDWLSPQTALLGGTGLALGGAAYSPLGRRALTALMAHGIGAGWVPPAVTSPLAQALRGTIPGATVYGSGLLNPPAQQQQ